MSREKRTLRVAAQLTILPKTITLVAEADLYPFKKGDVVMKIKRSTLDKMERPLNIEVISPGGGKNNTEKMTVKPIYKKP